MKRTLFLLYFFSSFCHAGVDVDVEHITVTASRTPIDVRETGSSVTIITKDQILRRNARNLAELLREIPGMAVSQTGSQGSVTQVRVRGAEANQVLVLIDGIEANDLALGSEFNFTHLLVSQIERVEIVRGPQSALWGSDALSGVINVVTLAPKDADSSFGVTAEAGSLQTKAGTVSINHHSERHQIRAYIDTLQTNGSNIARVGTEKDGYKNTTVNISGVYTPSETLEVSYSLRSTDVESDFDSIDFFTTGLPTDADYQTDSEQRYGGLSVKLALGKLDQIFSLAKIDTDNVNRTNSPVADITKGDKRQLQHQTNFYHGNHVFSNVFEYETEDYVQRGQVFFFGDPNKDLDMHGFSVAQEYRYNAEAFDFSLSARRDNNSDFQNATSWRSTLAWHYLPSTSFFTSIGESIKNPTFNDRFGLFDNFLGNPDLTPEESFSWELGIRHTLANTRISATWHDASLDNEINGFAFSPDTGAFTAENVSGKSKRRGAEIEFSHTFNSIWSLSASYGYLNATQDSSGADIVEVRRPKNTASCRTDFTFVKGNISAGVMYNGKQRDDFFPPFPRPQERVTLNSFILMNVSASYRVTDKITVTARAENLLDEDYEEVFGFASPGLRIYGGLRISL